MHGKTILASITVALVLLFAPSVAAQQMEQGVGLLCDTADQVARFAQLRTEGTETEAAAERVNVEVEKPNACAFAKVIFVRGPEERSVRVPEGTASIAPVIIVAFFNGMGWVRIPPTPQFSIFLTVPNVDA